MESMAGPGTGVIVEPFDCGVEHGGRVVGLLDGWMDGWIGLDGWMWLDVVGCGCGK